jgi:hypothetical protein
MNRRASQSAHTVGPISPWSNKLANFVQIPPESCVEPLDWINGVDLDSAGSVRFSSRGSSPNLVIAGFGRQSPPAEIQPDSSGYFASCLYT